MTWEFYHFVYKYSVIKYSAVARLFYEYQSFYTSRISTLKMEKEHIVYYVGGKRYWTEGCLSSVEQNKVEKVKERSRRLGVSGETETNRQERNQDLPSKLD